MEHYLIMGGAVLVALLVGGCLGFLFRGSIQKDIARAVQLFNTADGDVKAFFDKAKKVLPAIICLVGFLLLCLVPADAQSRQFRGNIRASDFQYSIPITTGTTATGAGSITVQSGSFMLPGGTTFFPFQANPISGVWPQVQIVDGAYTEVVTLTGASGCGNSISSIPTCILSFGSSSYTHAAGASVRSGTGGAQEAILAAGTGNMVFLDSTFTSATLPGTWSLPSGVAPIEDMRSVPVVYWGNKAESTLISAPAAPTIAISAGGALGAGAYYIEVTYVDALGGESLSTESSGTVTATASNATITVTSPAASTGAVGFRAYVTAAAGGNGTEILAAPTCTAAPNTWLPKTCALGSPAYVTANPTTTAKIPTKSTAHTIITPKPFNTLGAIMPYQNWFFAFAVDSSESAASLYDLAQFSVPAPAMNYLGKKYRLCFSADGTGTSTTTVPVFNIQVANEYGQTPHTIATYTFAAITGASWNFRVCTHIAIAAVGTSATAYVDGLALASLGSTGASTQIIQDGNTTAVALYDLTKPVLTFTVQSAPTGNTFSTVMIRNLTFLPLN